MIIHSTPSVFTMPLLMSKVSMVYPSYGCYSSNTFFFWLGGGAEGFLWWKVDTLSLGNHELRPRKPGRSYTLCLHIPKSEKRVDLDSKKRVAKTGPIDYHHLDSTSAVPQWSCCSWENRRISGYCWFKGNELMEGVVRFILGDHRWWRLENER